jgi:glutamate decarboxylase
MLSEIWNAPQATETVGHATTGSSEAILLAGLTMKRLWLRKGLSCRPNLIVGNHAHLAIDKFANICDVDLKKIPISVESNFCFDTTQLEDAVNEGTSTYLLPATNIADRSTVGVLLILGNTYTGHFDAVKEVSYILDDVQKSRGLDVRIHVDAASGGFVAPFTNLERSQW